MLTRIETLLILARDDSNGLIELGKPVDFLFVKSRIEILLARTSPHLVDKYKPVYEALYARAMLATMRIGDMTVQ